MQNAGLDEAQAGIKIAGRKSNNLRYADDTTLMARLVWRNGTPLASRVVQGVTGHLSSCV